MKWMTQLCVFLVAALTQLSVLAAPAVTTLPENRILLFNDYSSNVWDARGACAKWFE